MNKDAENGKPVLGGKPPGLSLPVSSEPRDVATAKRQNKMAKDPPPRLPAEQVHGIIRALDIWALIENTAGDTHSGDDIFYEEEEEAMGYGKKGKLFWLEGQRARNPTHANRASRGEWEQREFLCEMEKRIHQTADTSKIW